MVKTPQAFDLRKVVRPHLFGLRPYSSARDEFTGTAEVFLDANENALGSATKGLFNRYPDPHHRAIRQRLSKLKAVNSSQIFLGNGSDEPIDLLIRATCEPGEDETLILTPTYGMYEVSTAINHVKLRKAPLTSTFQIDIKTTLQAVSPKTKIIWVCSPNNPSGNLLEPKAIEALLEASQGLVVVDEAYIDFANSASWIQRLVDFPNLVVLQTFSKAWGLAGIRAGVCYASSEIVEVLSKIKPPYNLGSQVQQLILEALDNVNRKDFFVTAILRQRKYLRQNLAMLATVKEIYHSDANFLLLKLENAANVLDFLRKEGIIVRDRSKVPGSEGCLRITVGTEKENELLLEALRKYEESSIIVK